MNNTLPIVVLPSRGRWALLAVMLSVGVVAGVCLLALGWIPGETKWENFGFYAAIAIAAFAAPFAWRNCIAAPPRMIIDEDGVGGRFIGGGFVGTTRIAWDDITGARFWQMHHYTMGFQGAVVRRVLCLDVNNDNRKYIPVRRFLHKLRSFEAKVEKYIPIVKGSAFSFNITHSELNEKQAEEIVAVINKLAKGKPPESGKAEESGKSPFVAD